MYYCLDWKKIVDIIVEKNLKYVRAGLNGDWDNTCSVIFREGRPVTEEDARFYSCSDWAIPAIEYADEEEMEFVRENCFYKIEDGDKGNFEIDPNEKWPVEALIYWIEKKKEKKIPKNSMSESDERAQSKPHIHQYEDSLSYKNSLKAIKNHADGIITEIKRIQRADENGLSEKAIGEISEKLMKLTGFLENFYNSYLESTDENTEAYLKLRAIYNRIPKVFQESMGSADADQKFQIMKDAINFVEQFHEVLLNYSLQSIFGINLESLKDFKGNEELN